MSGDEPTPRLGPLLAWLLIQLAALGLPCARVPLSARFPSAAETLALDELLVAQVVFAGMLSPVLLKDWRSFAASILTALPFISLSGYLASATIAVESRASLILCAWLVLLWLWQRALTSRHAGIILVATANLLTIGLPLVWLVRWDASATVPQLDRAPGIYVVSPTIAALYPARSSTAFLFCLFAVGGSGVALVTHAVLIGECVVRQVIHRKLSTT
jgi:hypothetical protein